MTTRPTTKPTTESVERSPIVHLHGDSAGVLTERASYVGSIGGDLLRRYVVHLGYARRRVRTDGAQVVLTLRRDGAERTVTLVVRRVV